MKNILQGGNRSQNKYVGRKAFLKAGNQAYLSILVNFQAPGSGSRTAKSMRIRIHNSDNTEESNPRLTLNFRTYDTSPGY
jgi:hypothetical protein